MLAFMYFFLVLFLASGYHEADFRKGNEEPRAYRKLKFAPLSIRNFEICRMGV